MWPAEPAENAVFCRPASPNASVFQNARLKEGPYAAQMALNIKAIAIFIDKPVWKVNIATRKICCRKELFDR